MKKYMARVCLSRYTSVFYKKYLGCYGCARSADFVYFLSLFIAVALQRMYVLASSPSKKFTVCLNHQKGPTLGILCNLKQKVTSYSIALDVITVSVHTSIATHTCMSVSESQKTWPKVSGHKKSSRCETFC